MNHTERPDRATRLNIFAKGNLDVRDTLHAFRSSSAVLWNGINEVVREQFPGTLIRLRHELCTRSDALLEARCVVPAELSERHLPLDPYTAETQFSTALFETDADVIVLSIQPDLTIGLFRHRRDGYLLCPSNEETWPKVDRAWLHEAFEPTGLLDVCASMDNFERIVGRLRQRSPAPILVYNVSSVVPGESVHCYGGMDEIFSTRIRRFNLGLIDLSQRTGISVIDVDTVLARAGALNLKLDAMHFTAEGCRVVAQEVVRVLDDLGCFLPAGAG